jgi:hypothetical protein
MRACAQGFGEGGQDHEDLGNALSTGRRRFSVRLDATVIGKNVDIAAHGRGSDVKATGCAAAWMRAFRDILH